jgi:hypothetical protein
MRSSSSHEGCERKWSILAKNVGDSTGVKEVHACQIEWKQENGKWIMTEVAKSICHQSRAGAGDGLCAC